MSHFTKIRTRLKDAAALEKALADLGFRNVEIHESPQHLYGYQGDKRMQKAELIVRRRYIGAASNDLGFKKDADGNFEFVVSEFDSLIYNQSWLESLNRRYSYHTVLTQLESQGFELAQEQSLANEQIKLTLRRSS